MRNHRNPFGLLAMALLLPLGAAAAAENDPPAPPEAGGEAGEALDWGQVPFLGQEPPAWQRVMEEAESLLEMSFAAHQAGDAEEAAHGLDRAEALAGHPDLPPEPAGQLLYMLGMLAQQFGLPERALGLFGRMVAMADAGQMQPPGQAALVRGLGLAQQAEINYLHLGRPAEAVRLFEEAMASGSIPAEFRSTVLSRLLQVRLLYAECFDAEAILGLARREMAWSVYDGRGGQVGPDARLPGHWAAALAANGRADEARALLALCQEREVSFATGEMALPLALAHGLLGDAAGAALWLERDLSHAARFRSPREFAEHLDRAEAAHALQGVLQDGALRQVLASWRARAGEAAAAGRPQVADLPSLFGDFGEFGDLEDLSPDE